MTTQEIRQYIIIDLYGRHIFDCINTGMNCDDRTVCPFDAIPYCGGFPNHFDFASMKLGTETELKDLLKYKSKDNMFNYPNLK
jgi:hypothetical protein